MAVAVTSHTHHFLGCEGGGSGASAVDPETLSLWLSLGMTWTSVIECLEERTHRAPMEGSCGTIPGGNPQLHDFLNAAREWTLWRLGQSSGHRDRAHWLVILVFLGWGLTEADTDVPGWKNLSWWLGPPQMSQPREDLPCWGRQERGCKRGFLPQRLGLASRNMASGQDLEEESKRGEEAVAWGKGQVFVFR